ncbi:mitochondrial ribosomal protein L27-domain-containing protein [Scheffersomyces coipomensis]|uniref:mitochondrial ribosomal protein L27-domain-containing protein n=1 Tax=Scheffersomyces coipomensis TaxID=1788519 RepID=UPI00315CEB50
MKASSVLNFQQTALANLKRPWQTFKDGQIWYGFQKTGSKRVPLTTKHGNKHYYKGTRSSGIGRLNKNATYMINWQKVRTYVVPDLSNTELKALVSGNSPQIYQKVTGYADGFKNPDLALNRVIDFVEHGEHYDDLDLEKTQYFEHIINPEVEKAEDNFEQLVAQEQKQE